MSLVEKQNMLDIFFWSKQKWEVFSTIRQLHMVTGLKTKKDRKTLDLLCRSVSFHWGEKKK